MRQQAQEKIVGEGFDKDQHWVLVDKKKCRSRCKMPGCIFYTHLYCSKCEIHFCITSKRNCFYSFHNPQKKTASSNNNEKHRKRRNENARLSGGDSKKPRSTNVNSKTHSSACKNGLKTNSSFGSRTDGDHYSASDDIGGPVTRAKKIKCDASVSSSSVGATSGNRGATDVEQNNGRMHLMRDSKNITRKSINFTSEKKATHKVSMKNAGETKSNDQEDFLRSLQLVRSAKMLN